MPAPEISLETPGADFDVFQLNCAAASLVFRKDDEIAAEREEIERAINLLTSRLAELPPQERRT
jgi:hypothetical protein